MKEFKIGRLSNTPEIRTVKVDGKELKVTNVSMYIQDRSKKLDTGNYSSVPIRLIAWNEQANLLSNFNKGDLIGVVGYTACIDVTHDGETYSRYGLRVKDVFDTDKALEVNRELGDKLSEFSQNISSFRDLKKTLEQYVQTEKDFEEIDYELGDELEEMSEMEDNLPEYFDDMPDGFEVSESEIEEDEDERKQ